MNSELFRGNFGYFFVFSSQSGEMIQFDQIFPEGLKPQTSTHRKIHMLNPKTRGLEDDIPFQTKVIFMCSSRLFSRV